MSNKDKHKDKKKKREKIKQFLKESKKHLKKIAKRALSDLPPEAQEVIKGAVRTTLDVLSGTFPTCLLPENTQVPITRSLPTPPREYTFQEIDDLIFERIKDIVSHASSDERFPQGFSNHLLDPNDPEKGMLDEKIKSLQYTSVVNLISRIRKELNVNVSGEQKDVLNDEPNLEAVLAIRGLMNTLTKPKETEGRVIIEGLSDHNEVNRFITACFREPENIFKTHDYKSLDHQYYAFVVGNAKFLLEEEFMDSFDPSKVQQGG
jgi:hypothetical protein